MTAKIKIPALVRAYRDGPAESYDRDDLQVALDDDGINLEAPRRHVFLRSFYETYFKKPFPPLVMLVEVQENRFGDLEVDLVSNRNRAYYVKLLLENGADVAVARQPLIYLQGDAGYEFIENELSQANRRDMAGGYSVRIKMSRDMFDHYFGWSNIIDMGY